ncbi:response regulator [Candidatus Woesebacteria bacterium]|nr:MAG: response regulator [Candidatus Woesebacteria bacterium]
MSKVLIIEDDSQLTNMYEKKLSGEGFTVLITSEGKKGITLAKREKPDIILLDIMLPGGMNGFDVLKELRLDEKFKSTPILMFTNLDSEKETATDFGADGYIIKAETTPTAIVERIKKLVG